MDNAADTFLQKAPFCGGAYYEIQDADKHAERLEKLASVIVLHEDVNAWFLELARELKKHTGNV